MVESRTSAVSRSSTASSSRKAQIEDYEIGGELGEGAYGRVCFATERSNGRKVAVKEINKEKIAKVNMEHHIFREKNILNALGGHPNVV
jgi:serine/threonine protein kinase